MALSIPDMTTTIAGCMTSNGVVGPAMPQLSSALAAGIYQSLLNAQVTTIDTGTTGVGTGFMIGIITSSIVNYKIMKPIMESYSIGGQSSSNVVSALSTAIYKILMHATVQTFHYTVGTGSAICRFNLEKTSTFQLMQSAFASSGVSGSMSSNMAAAVSDSLCSIMQSAFATVPIVGTVSPSPASGIGSGRIL